ncbi:MAG TPA: helix-turn-helix domain-containing protein [Candidatus Methylacidiphilales bacterium]|nr:helix-turn-helix domain-containing protein [Candidatus Methylacidiphilales bacterium]
MQTSREIVRQLSQSEIYRDYEAAFTEVTHLPLSFRPHEIWQHALGGKKNENPFCALLAKSSKSCAACLQMQEKTTEGGMEEPCSVMCFAGLVDTAVPVRVGTKVIGFLQTGQIALSPPTHAQFTKIARQIVEWGVSVDLNRLEDAYFHSQVLSRQQYEGVVRLLEIFAQHLSVFANQIMVHQRNAEPPMISRAKNYINSHQTGSISLDEVARALNVSTFYFCKMFKKTTGLTFTDYLSRARVEKAKNLLLNPHVRVSEAAYECGFASLTHFNRTFKRVTGASSTVFRKGFQHT